MKIANIAENFHISRLEEIHWDFQESQGFTLSIEDTIFKPQGGGRVNLDSPPPPPRHIRVKMSWIKNLPNEFLITYYPSGKIFKDQKYPLNSIFW